MKKLLFVLAIAIFCVIDLPAQQSVAGFPTVTVTGTAEIFVVPDEVTFSAKIEKTGKTLAEAKQSHDTALARLISAARRFVTDEKDIKTDFLSVAEHFKRVKTVLMTTNIRMCSWLQGLPLSHDKASRYFEV